MRHFSKPNGISPSLGPSIIVKETDGLRNDEQTGAPMNEPNLPCAYRTRHISYVGCQLVARRDTGPRGSWALKEGQLVSCVMLAGRDGRFTTVVSGCVLRWLCEGNLTWVRVVAAAGAVVQRRWGGGGFNIKNDERMGRGIYLVWGWSDQNEIKRLALRPVSLK